MKYILAFSVFLTYCTTKQAQNTDLQTNINRLMNQWHSDAANANFEAYIGLMDSTCNYIGTDATENWKRDEFATFCKPYFDKKTTWDFKLISRTTSCDNDGNTAWFDEILDTHMGTCRGSGVLVLNSENKWKLKQYVLSVAIPNESMEAVKEAKFAADSIFKAKVK